MKRCRFHFGLLVVNHIWRWIQFVSHRQIFCCPGDLDLPRTKRKASRQYQSYLIKTEIARLTLLTRNRRINLCIFKHFLHNANPFRTYLKALNRNHQSCLTADIKNRSHLETCLTAGFITEGAIWTRVFGSWF